jgi:uncharacterized membrane protein YvlD (DUF360 family)
MRRATPPMPNSGIYRLILWLMVATVVCGVILAIAAGTLVQDPALGRFGTGMALIGAAIYGFFRWLGAREARHQQDQRRDTPPPP